MSESKDKVFTGGNAITNRIKWYFQVQFYNVHNIYAWNKILFVKESYKYVYVKYVILI